jgi:predicted enzyme related to lactoylglutathione lyase
MPILDLAGVLIHTTLDRHAPMRSFYVEALGLTPRSDREGFVNFEFGGRRLTITLHDRVDGANADPLRIMVNFAVDDVDATFKRLVEHGAPAIRPPSPEPWGGLIATSADPDGNIIQLMELPD